MRKKVISLLIIAIIIIATITICYTVKANKSSLVAQNENNGSIKIEEENKKIANTIENKEIYSKSYTDEEYKNLPINYTSASYVYDTSSPEKATGVADYSFVAKIKGVIRTEYRNPAPAVHDGVEVTVYNPYTVYDVEIIENIKGELDKSKNIEVVLHGGVSEDGKSCTFLEGLDFFNVGEYYILLPYTATDGRLGISNRTSIVSLGKLSETEAKSIDSIDKLAIYNTDTKENGRNSYTDTIKTYINAEKNPIVPEDKKRVKSQIYDVEVSNLPEPIPLKVVTREDLNRADQCQRMNEENIIIEYDRETGKTREINMGDFKQSLVEANTLGNMNSAQVEQ